MRFIDIDKLIPWFIWKDRKPNQTKTKSPRIFKANGKKKKMGGLPQPKLKSYRKVPVVKKVMLIFLKKVTLINRTEI